MTFQKELAGLINKHCVENESDTPDHILAKYICGCLDAWNEAVSMRSKWWGHKTWSSNETIEDS